VCRTAPSVIEWATVVGLVDVEYEHEHHDGERTGQASDVRRFGDKNR
jgi:hypothetical protein